MRPEARLHLLRLNQSDRILFRQLECLHIPTVPDNPIGDRTGVPKPIGYAKRYPRGIDSVGEDLPVVRFDPKAISLTTPFK